MAKQKRSLKSASTKNNLINWLIAIVTAGFLLIAIGGYFIYSRSYNETSISTTVQPEPQLAESEVVEVKAEVETVAALPVAPKIGALAPDFTLSDTKGNQVSLADYRGQPVVVTFFHSW